jgi:hypothetical protein
MIYPKFPVFPRIISFCLSVRFASFKLTDVLDNDFTCLSFKLFNQFKSICLILDKDSACLLFNFLNRLRSSVVNHEKASACSSVKDFNQFNRNLSNFHKAIA